MVTGGSGFLGRNLVEGLSAYCRVLAPGRRDVDLLDEIAVRRYLDKNPVDAVVHSATKPGHRNAPDPTGLIEANLRMFFNLARCSDLFGKMIVMGSGAVYDMRSYEPKMLEDHFGVHVPADEHGFSKYVQALYMERASDLVELRVFGVYGKYEDYSIRFISNAICKALFDLPITLRQDRLFDYVHVDDLVSVTRHFIENDASRIAYNVTPDRAVSLLDLAHLVLEISGKDLPVLVGAPGRGVEYSGDNARLRSEIPALVLTPIEEGVRGLYSWYEANLDRIDRGALLVDK
jgi:UDP-glucose 4-epimerase